MVNPTFLEDLSVVTININSLFNHNGSKLNGANLNLYKNSILNISDARISEDKYLLLKKNNENGNRFFTTISNTHRAGCAILFPQNYIKDVVNIMEDKNEIPRFLCITVVNYLGLKATFTCCYLPANKSNKIKMASIQGLYNCIEQIEAKVYSIAENFNLFVSGDFNIDLNAATKTKAGQNLLRLCSRFDLYDVIDRFRDKSNTYPTFIGSHANAKPHRIDGILISGSILNLLMDQSRVRIINNPGQFDTDHFSVHIEFIINKSNKNNEQFPRGDDTFMESETFLKILDSTVRDSLLKLSPNNIYMGGALSRAVIDKMTDSELDISYMDKNPLESGVPYFSIFYALIDDIIKVQKDFKSKVFKKEIEEENALKKEMCNIMRKNHHNKQDVHKLRKLNNTLLNKKREILLRKAKLQGIRSSAMGETMTRFFLMQKSYRKSKLKIKQMMLSNGMLTGNPSEIAQELGRSYKRIFTVRDPYVEGDLERFLGPLGISKMGVIQEPDRELCETFFSIAELEEAAKKIKKEGKGGADGVTGTIFHYIFPKLKYLFLNLANILAFSEKNAFTRTKRVNLIFLPKDTDKIDFKMVRPIGLSSNLYKLVSHLQAIRIRNAMSRANLYPSNLFAYLKGRRGDFAARILRDRLEMACNDTKERMFGFQFDIQGAFDNISRNYLCALFKLLGFGDNFIFTIRNMFQHISIKPCYDNIEIDDFYQISGVIQGGPSSVQFFIIGTIPLTIKLELDLEIETYQVDFDQIMKAKVGAKLTQPKKVFIPTDKIIQTPRGFDRNYALKKSAHFADDSMGFVKFKGVETVKKILNIYESYAHFASQPINRGKTRLFFSNIIENDLIRQIINLGFNKNNIIQPGGSIKFVGYSCQISASQLKTDYQIIRDKTQKISEILAKWDFKNALTCKGRRIIVNTLCTSQLNYFFPNMLCQKNWFEKAQKMINSFINKKKVTTNKVMHLTCKKGGMGVPWLYLKYLTSKANWFKTLRGIEEQDRDSWPDFATLLINLKNKFHFPSFKVMFHAGDNDWVKLANICFLFNLKFWGTTIHEFIKLRKMFKKPKKSKARKNNSLQKNWGDLNIFGSKHHIPNHKTGKDGWSMKQLLRPPEEISLSTRSVIVADIINLKGFYKVGHFIDSNDKPTQNISDIFYALKGKYRRTKIIGLLNLLFQWAYEIKKYMSKGNKGYCHMGRDYLLEKLLGFEDSVSLYNRAVINLFEPIEHPCLRKWNNIDVGIKVNNRKIMSGIHRIFSTTMCYIHLKYAQEALLCAIRTERHLVKMPDHPTGVIRPCNVCFGEDSLHHILISCPLAQIIWFRLKLAIQEIIKNTFDITIETILLSKIKMHTQCSKIMNKLILALICATRFVLMNIYYKRQKIFNIEDASYKHLDCVKSTLYLYKKYKIDIPKNFFDFILGKNIACGNETFDLLLKIRAALYSKNINVDGNPKLYNYFLILFNKRGKKVEQNLDYLRYCLKKGLEVDLITRLPMLINQQSEAAERKSKLKEWSKYKLKYICQLALNEIIEMDSTNENIQGTDYNVIYSLCSKR